MVCTCGNQLGWQHSIRDNVTTCMTCATAPFRTVVVYVCTSCKSESAGTIIINRGKGVAVCGSCHAENTVVRTEKTEDLQKETRYNGLT